MPSLTAGKRRKHKTSFLNNQLFFFLISAFSDFSQITDLWKIMDWNGLIWLYRGWSHFVDNGCKIYEWKNHEIGYFEHIHRFNQKLDMGFFGKLSTWKLITLGALFYQQYCKNQLFKPKYHFYIDFLKSWLKESSLFKANWADLQSIQVDRLQISVQP